MATKTQGVVAVGFIDGISREQTSYWSFEDLVDDESMVRVIDRYIDKCDLEQLGFNRTIAADTGRPGYAAAPLAKLYVYGYEGAIRSSRKLEKETRRNVEVMWLLDGLTPDYKTISEFRRLNIRPLQKLFREFVKLCRSWDLIGEELIAIDGSKFKASNNKKNNFSKKKLDDRIRRLDEKIDAYLENMDQEDKHEDSETKLPSGLLELLERKELYKQYKAQIESIDENEISTVDPDARLMGNNRGGVDVAYNVQSAVDGKNGIILDYDVSLKPSDHGQLSTMIKQLMRQGYRRFTALADKGYYNGDDLKKVKKFKIKAIVSKQKPSNPKTQPKQFNTDQFNYDSGTDTYRCPIGETLHPHSKKTAKRRNFYNKTACGKCPHTDLCTSGKNGYRTITRGEHAEIYDDADSVFRDNMKLYKLRQQIVEHPFGTIKHTMNGDHFLLRTRRKVRCEIALLFLGYNLKRAVKILGFREIMARLDSLLHRIDNFIHRLCVILHFWEILLPKMNFAALLNG
jgi:transposase